MPVLFESIVNKKLYGRYVQQKVIILTGIDRGPLFDFRWISQYQRSFDNFLNLPQDYWEI